VLHEKQNYSPHRRKRPRLEKGAWFQNANDVAQRHHEVGRIQGSDMEKWGARIDGKNGSR